MDVAILLRRSRGVFPIGIVWAEWRSVGYRGPECGRSADIVFPVCRMWNVDVDSQDERTPRG